MTTSRPLLGSGIGQFVPYFMSKFKYLPATVYQPVHNIYLLIVSETGFIGLGTFLLFLFFSICPSAPRSFYKKSGGAWVTNANPARILPDFLDNQRATESNDNNRNLRVPNRHIPPPTGGWAQRVAAKIFCKIGAGSFLIFIVSFLGIGLFDLFLWTAQQGGLVFWMILALISLNGS